MKVGDLVHDSTYVMNGVIIDEGILGTESNPSSVTYVRKWTVLYEDGQTDEAFDSELEMISESR